MNSTGHGRGESELKEVISGGQYAACFLLWTLSYSFEPFGKNFVTISFYFNSQYHNWFLAVRETNIEYCLGE